MKMIVEIYCQMPPKKQVHQPRTELEKFLLKNKSNFFLTKFVKMNQKNIFLVLRIWKGFTINTTICTIGPMRKPKFNRKMKKINKSMKFLWKWILRQFKPGSKTMSGNSMIDIYLLFDLNNKGKTFFDEYHLAIRIWFYFHCMNQTIWKIFFLIDELWT